jgi:hypothetical protein
MIMPDGECALSQNRDYITLWGYWNGLDADLSLHDQDHLKPINLSLAYLHKFIGLEEYRHLAQRKKDRLRSAGYHDMNPKGNHILLSLDAGGKLVRDAEGEIAERYCNFELVRPL